MTLGWGDELDRTVAMLVVVPANESGYPVTGLRDVGKCFARIVRTVLQRLEQGLGIRVVVADGRSAERRHYAKRLQGGEHRCAFHRAAIVGMQDHLITLDVFTSADIAHYFGRQVAVLVSIDLPANDLSAVDIDEHVQVKVDSFDPLGKYVMSQL